MAKCPFDRTRFYYQKDGSYLKPHVNIYALNNLPSTEESNEYEICQHHGEPIKYYCLIDKQKICSDCSISGNHSTHRVVRLEELKQKIKRKQEILQSHREQLIKYSQDTASLLEKRQFQELDMVEDLYEEQEQLLKKQKIEQKFKVLAAFNQEQKRVKEFLGEKSCLKNSLQKKIDEYNNMESANLGDIMNEDIQDLLSICSKKKLNEETLLFEENLDVATVGLNESIRAQISRMPNIDWGNLALDNPRQAIMTEDSQNTLLNLRFGVSEYKIKGYFGIGIYEENIDIKIDGNLREECLITVEELNRIKAVNVTLIGQVNDQDMTSLGYIFSKMSQIEAFTLRYESSNENKKQSRELLQTFFSHTQKLKNIQIDLEAKSGAEEAVKLLAREIKSKKLELETLRLNLKKDIILYDSFESLVQSLEYSQNSLSDLSVVTTVNYCNKDRSLKPLHMSNLRAFTWEVECSCEPCKEPFHNMIAKFLLDCFMMTKNLEKLDYSLMVTEKMNENDFVEIFKKIQELKQINELKVTISDTKKNTVMQKRNLVRLVGDIVPPLSQMDKLENLWIGKKSESFHECKTQPKIWEFLSHCLENSMRYQVHS